MKLLLVVVALGFVCVVLFVTGVLSPRRSRRMQDKVDEVAQKGEVKGDADAGRLGDVTRDALEKTRRAADASAEKGRDVRDRIAPER
ncbi:MAG: hypothetical protein M3273_09475 [Actinomycetota bacterium]|nr:hypothetical protein [Actinomycetota bacterium]